MSKLAVEKISAGDRFISKKCRCLAVVEKLSPAGGHVIFKFDGSSCVLPIGEFRRKYLRAAPPEEEKK